VVAHQADLVIDVVPIVTSGIEERVDGAVGVHVEDTLRPVVPRARVRRGRDVREILRRSVVRVSVRALPSRRHYREEIVSLCETGRSRTAGEPDVLLPIVDVAVHRLVAILAMA